jgi:hypothetical protein
MPVVKVKKTLDKKQVAKAGIGGAAIGGLVVMGLAVAAVKKFGTEFIDAVMGDRSSK